MTITRTIILTLVATIAATLAAAAQPVLRVYGPGGPAEAMKECAAVFAREHGRPVEIVAGPEPQWLDQAKTDADVFYGGAEYMLTQFTMRNPGLVDSTTRRSLWIRAIGILVRPGNPKRIRKVSDLAREGVRIIEVAGAGQVGAWEDIAGELIPRIQKNTVIAVANTAHAIDRWRADASIDAWVNFESWHVRLDDVTDLVRLPAGQRIYRGTPVAVATTSDQRADALAFIEFLASERAHAIFRKWGWK